MTVLTDDECNYLWATGQTDRPSFVREVEEAVLLRVELSELIGMQAYIERLTAERDSLAEQLEDATDRMESAVERSLVLNRFIYDATPEMFNTLSLHGSKLWRKEGFSKAQAKVMVILAGLAFINRWKR